MGRRLLLLLLLAFALVAARGADAAPPEDEAACCCVLGTGACQHYLRNPAGPTDDPCWCDRCQTGLQGRRHDGSTVPPGWSAVCFRSDRMPCYLKRHAEAWGITCSECLRLDKCCPSRTTADCPRCDDTAAPAPEPGAAAAAEAVKVVRTRLAKEAQFFKKPEEVVLAMTRHFYVVTDIEGLKVRLPTGIPRPISRHEWLHLMIERAEWCRREWVRRLGEPTTKLPMGVWFCAKEADKAKVAAAYLASPRATYLLGNAGKTADGLCITGIAISKERYGGDHDLQLEFRHQLVHNLFSCFGHHETRPRSFPQWAFEGLAHWMEKSTPPFEDDATYCAPEGAAPGSERKGGGKDWARDLSRLATAGKLDPIEKLLGKSVKGELTEDDHKRAWSLVSTGLSDLGKPFVDLLADLRKERDVREAFVARLGMTPEELDRRWRDRVTGKRASLSGEDAPAGTSSSPSGKDSPSARERRSIAEEQDPVTLAAKIRQQGAIADPEIAAVVADQLARKSDLVRETALVTLLKLEDAACRKRLVEYGLAHEDASVRAYVARLCGRLLLRDAAPKLSAMLQDSNWFPRAEAAVALGRLRERTALPQLGKMAGSDSSEKAQVAAMDALGLFGGDADAAVPLLARQLAASQWQTRAAACQALGAIGTMEAVDPLVARMEVESGRVRDEIRAALRAIVRDDLGPSPDIWRAWWDKEKEKHPGSLPPRPGEAASTGRPPPPKDDRYAAPPEYYGIEIFSDRVGFVVDTSQSMALLFTPDPAAAKVLSREYSGRDKLSICREEVAHALHALLPESRFVVVTFGTAIRSSSKNPVAATKANVDSALDFLATVPASGETNYYDALRAALDLGDGPETGPDFRSTPDTITFLTDGEPTAGEVTDGDTLVEWYAGLNRYARVRTHTVTFGLNRVDQPLLRRLAEQNGGRFVVVPEAKK